MSAKEKKVSVLYGRARRIELTEKIVYIVVGIFSVVLVIYLVFHVVTKVDENQHYEYLRNYMASKGFACESLDESGRRCTLKNELYNYSFMRNDNGFEYLIITDSYRLTIKHAPNNESIISLMTTDYALAGYRGHTYSCNFKESVIGELDTCVNEFGDVLDSSLYRGIISSAMNDLNDIIDSSGYSKSKLIEEFMWIREK